MEISGVLFYIQNSLLWMGSLGTSPVPVLLSLRREYLFTRESVLLTLGCLVFWLQLLITRWIVKGGCHCSLWQLCTTDTGLPPAVQTNSSSYSQPNRGNTAPPMTFWVFKLCLQGLQVDFLRCPRAERGKDTWRKRMERQEAPWNCSGSRGHGNVTRYLSKDSFPRLLACSFTPNVCQSSHLKTMVERKSMPLYFICQGCMVNPLVRNRAWRRAVCHFSSVMVTDLW